MSAISKAVRRAIVLRPPVPNTRAGGRLRRDLAAVRRGWSDRTASRASESSPSYSEREVGTNTPASPTAQSLGLAAVQRWRGSGGINSSRERRGLPATSESKGPRAPWFSTPRGGLGKDQGARAGVGDVARWTVGDKAASGAGIDVDRRGRHRGAEGRARPEGESGGEPNARRSRYGRYRVGTGGGGSEGTGGVAAAFPAPARGDGLGQACIMRRLKQAKARRDADAAERVLEEALAQDDAADVVDVFVYSAAVGVFAKAGRWEAALGVLSAMKEKGVQPNAFTYNQAIAACGNGGAWEWAVYLLKAMPKVGVPPDVVSYNAAIAACGAGRQPELAVVLLREMAPGVTPNAVTYAAAMSAIVAPSGATGAAAATAAAAAAAAASTPGWRRAVQLLGEMRGAGATPDAACYGPAVAACTAAGEVDKAIELLRQMHREDGVMLDLESYNAVMTACRRASKWQQAVLLWDEMRRWEGVSPDDVTYAEVVAACRKGGQSGQLEADLRDEMLEVRRG